MSELKRLTILNGSLQRLLKDLEVTKKEIERENARLVTMKADEAEPGRLRQQQTVIEEAEALIPDTLTRIGKARDELREYIAQEDIAQHPDIVESEALTKAQTLLASASEHL